jgi:hypothetical protein
MNNLEELGFPHVFKAIANGTAPTDLGATCLPTGTCLGMQADLATHLPAAADYVPLWGLNSFGVVAFDRRRRVFVRYYIGDADDTVVARDYDELCAFLFLELMDAGVDESLGEFAGLFHFEHLDALRAFVVQHHVGPSRELVLAFSRALRSSG